MLWVLQVDVIQMGTHHLCLYKEVDKKYTGCNLKTTELFDCALIGVCAVIWSDYEREYAAEVIFIFFVCLPHFKTLALCGLNHQVKIN